MHRKWMISVALFLAFILVLSGCDIKETMKNTEESIANKVSTISIPYKWFRVSNDDENDKVIKKVHGLNLGEQKVGTKKMTEFKERVSKISEYLEDKDTFRKVVDGDKTIFNVLGTEYLSMTYGEDGNKDEFTNVIQEFGKVPYQWINSLTLRQYGVQTNDKGEAETFAVIDVNAVNDTEDFKIQTLLLSLDKDGLITQSEKLGSPVDKSNTVTPLTKDSFLYKSTHKEFQRNLEKTLQSLSNPSLYEDIQLGKITKTDTAIQSLTKQIGIDSKNTSTIYSLVKDGQGTFDEWGITGYLYDDKNVKANTLYELAVSNDSGYHVYTVNFNRGTKKITNISKGSPFKEANK